MKRKQSFFNIAVALGLEHKVHRDIASGVLRFAATKDNWEVRILPYTALTSQGTGATAHWRIDGIIAGTPPGDFPRRRKVPLITIDPAPGQTRQSDMTVRTGDITIGSTAADYLLARHFTRFAYVPSSDPGENHHCRLRERGFADVLARRGFDHRRIEILTQGTPELKPLKALARELDEIPKPCAVFAYNDIAARYVLDACHYAGIAIPECMSILGVDDQREITEYTRPQLSSILPDFEASGYAAAELLSKLLSGEETTAKTITTGVIGVIERMSTQDHCGSRRIVSAAIEYMKLHFREHLTTRELARHLNASPRLLEIRFKEALGHSVHEKLAELRLNEATRLLSNASTSLSSIAEQCGYHSPLGLRKAFCKKHRMTLREYRMTKRNPSSALI